MGVINRRKQGIVSRSQATHVTCLTTSSANKIDRDWASPFVARMLIHEISGGISVCYTTWSAYSAAEALWVVIGCQYFEANPNQRCIFLPAGSMQAALIHNVYFDQMFRCLSLSAFGQQLPRKTPAEDITSIRRSGVSQTNSPPSQSTPRHNGWVLLPASLHSCTRFVGGIRRIESRTEPALSLCSLIAQIQEVR